MTRASSSDPVIVDAQLQTRINAIEHHLRIVRNIARKQAAEAKTAGRSYCQRKVARRTWSAIRDPNQRAGIDRSSRLHGRCSSDAEKIVVRRTDSAVGID